MMQFDPSSRNYLTILLVDRPKHGMTSFALYSVHDRNLILFCVYDIRY
jgi:hypothetical protein